jgi:hypothetical protein
MHKPLYGRQRTATKYRAKRNIFRPFPYPVEDYFHPPALSKDVKFTKNPPDKAEKVRL